jgi:hypothetical protein
MTNESSLAIDVPSTKNELSPSEDQMSDPPPSAQTHQPPASNPNPRQPIISNFRVLAKTNVVLRGAQASSQRRE